MKPSKRQLPSTNKFQNVPPSPYNKKPNLVTSSKSKEKPSAKAALEKPESMILRSPPTGESIVRYALPIPSSKTKELIAEGESIKRITQRLQMIVSSLEETYGSASKMDSRQLLKPGQEELSFSILESLFKWFQQQVNEMEEGEWKISGRKTEL